MECTTADLLNSLVVGTSNLTRTENAAVAYRGTLDPCVDFFFKVVPSTPEDTALNLLKKSWKADALFTLKLIFQLRAVRVGKNDKKQFYRCIQWVIENHPKTFLANMHLISEFGYWKDILEILKWYFMLQKPGAVRQNVTGPAKKLSSNVRKIVKALRSPRAPKPKRELSPSAAHFAVVKALRKELLNESSFFREALDRCASMFADALKDDLALMKEKKRISLAAKWCPSIDGTHDRYLGISKLIALKLFPLSEQELTLPDHVKLELAIRAKNRLRQDYYVPLRRYGHVTEVFMSADEWNNIVYSRVHSLCMKNNTKHFLEHDCERFQQFLEQVKKGEATITASALLPHKIVNAIQQEGKSESEYDALELQWNRYEKDLRDKGSLRDALAICDVSGSMKGEPMTVALALSLLTASLCETAYKNIVCTFSQDPEFFQVPDAPLREKLMALSHAKWGMNTNFEKVFEIILNRAVSLQLPADQMIKRVFVFSDMQFDAAASGTYSQTTHERLQTSFKEAGYELPQVVFWNLRCSPADSVPVTKHSTGALLMSGFSGQMLQLFMKGEALNIMELVLKSIRDPLYDRLKVVGIEDEKVELDHDFVMV